MGMHITYYNAIEKAASDYFDAYSAEMKKVDINNRPARSLTWRFIAETIRRLGREYELEPELIGRFIGGRDWWEEVVSRERIERTDSKLMADFMKGLR